MSSVLFGALKLSQQQLGLFYVDSFLQLPQMVITDLAWVLNPVETQLQVPEFNFGQATLPSAFNLLTVRLHREG